MRDLLAIAARFGLVGVANTVLGLCIIAGLDLGLHLNAQVANALGYAAGMALSYVLNRSFVFQNTATARSTLPKFIAAMAIAFAVNQAVLFLAGKLLGSAPQMRLAAQALAIGTYTVVNFGLCRFWVFRAAPPAEAR
jgi:putative flippase GtrA